MITKIGVIYQDRNSIGFLRGLRDRLKCEAEFVEPPARIGKPPVLPRKGAKRAWAHFQKHGVDLVVRFTDADRERWQQVRRQETSEKVVPKEAGAMWICGVAVDNPEEWICLDIPYFADLLGLSHQELRDPVHRTDRIKRALTRMARSDEGQSDVVTRIVRDAPTRVFRSWLKNNDALRTFYSDCRAAASRVHCETPNELEGTDEQ